MICVTDSSGVTNIIGITYHLAHLYDECHITTITAIGSTSKT